jgi:hypothetical protein
MNAPATLRFPAFAMTSRSIATTYRFVDRSGLGTWALCTVNDDTGELSVTSDWGNWSYRWDTRATGCPSLTHFIGERDACHYLADKLCPRAQREEFAPDLTVDGIHARILERRREERISREHAREWWNEANEALDTDNLIEFAEQLDSLPQWMFDRCEDIRHRPTTSYLVLRDAILPALVDACRLTCHRRDIP